MSQTKVWTAKVWLGSTGGEIDAEVNANNINQAREILERRYSLDPNDLNQIRNLKQKSNWSNSSSSDTDVEGSAALIGIIAVLALAWWLLPWMLAGGAIYGGYKLSKKITGEDIDSLGKKSNEKAAFTMALIVALSGSVGFFGGKAIKGEFNAPAPAVEEVVPKEDL